MDFNAGGKDGGYDGVVRRGPVGEDRETTPTYSEALFVSTRGTKVFRKKKRRVLPVRVATTRFVTANLTK